MVRGFYMLGSGTITNNRILNGVSNNIANVKTVGYKKEQVMASSFGDMVLSRIDGNRYTELGTVSTIRAATETATIHSQGSFQGTERALDFAIVDGGFFAVEGANGVRYTRNGSFNMDAEGYLILSGQGRVLGKNGAPILVGSDNVESDDQGNLSVGGKSVGSLGIYDFDDYNADLQKAGNGFYTGDNANLMERPTVRWKSLEASNVDMASEMSDAMATMRDLQSVSQALKMYDNILGQALSQVAKV